MKLGEFGITELVNLPAGELGAFLRCLKVEGFAVIL